MQRTISLASLLLLALAFAWNSGALSDFFSRQQNAAKSGGSSSSYTAEWTVAEKETKLTTILKLETGAAEHLAAALSEEAVRRIVEAVLAKDLADFAILNAATGIFLEQRPLRNMI